MAYLRVEGLISIETRLGRDVTMSIEDITDGIVNEGIRQSIDILVIGSNMIMNLSVTGSDEVMKVLVIRYW